MSSLPTSLRIAFAFVAALWIVGLAAFAAGAPGEVVVASAAIGTVGALVELTSHRWESPDAPADDARAGAGADMQAGPAPRPDLRRID